jgi:hypothetical protein
LRGSGSHALARGLWRLREGAWDRSLRGRDVLTACLRKLARLVKVVASDRHGSIKSAVVMALNASGAAASTSWRRVFVGHDTSAWRGAERGLGAT